MLQMFARCGTGHNTLKIRGEVCVRDGVFQSLALTKYQKKKSLAWTELSLPYLPSHIRSPNLIHFLSYTKQNPKTLFSVVCLSP